MDSLLRLANFIGENIGIKSSQIEFGIQRRRRWLTIPEYLELEIEGIKGSDSSQDSLVTNPAFTVAPGFDPVIARSIKHHYAGAETTLPTTGPYCTRTSPIRYQMPCCNRPADRADRIPDLTY